VIICLFPISNFTQHATSPLQRPNEVPFLLLSSLSDNSHFSTGSLSVPFRFGLAHITQDFPHTFHSAYYLPLLVFSLTYSQTLRIGKYVPPICQALYELHDITTQKTIFFILRNVFLLCELCLTERYIQLQNIRKTVTVKTEMSEEELLSSNKTYLVIQTQQNTAESNLEQLH
jgi:hypothetical protein